MPTEGITLPSAVPQEDHLHGPDGGLGGLPLLHRQAVDGALGDDGAGDPHAAQSADLLTRPGHHHVQLRRRRRPAHHPERHGRPEQVHPQRLPRIWRSANRLHWGLWECFLFTAHTYSVDLDVYDLSEMQV